MMSKRIEANEIVKKHVIWSLGGGLLPLPLLDFAAVTAIQIDMLSQLARLYEVDYTMARGKTLVAGLTGSTAAKIGSSLVKAVPGIGPVIGGLSMSLMSGASTYALAQVAIGHFESGGNLLNIDLDAAKRTYQAAAEEGKAFVSALQHDKEKTQDPLEKLEKLERLKKEGILTDDEFQEKKQQILDSI